MTGEELDRLCNHRLLTPAEEKALSKRALRGDQEAIDTLVCSNLRLVASLAKHFVTTRITMGDCVNAGTVGLITAAKRFDYKKKTRFSTFAVYWVQNELLKLYWRQQSALIHVPAYLSELFKKEQKGELLTEREKLFVECAHRARQAYSNVYELSMDNEPKAVEEEPPDITDFHLAKLEKAMSRLVEEDRTILKARFGLPPYTRSLTLKEVGEIEGKTRERIRQIQQRAMDRLRAVLADEGLISLD